jgi:hypothetical protein
MIPTAEAMGDAIWANTLKLISAGILEGVSNGAAARLRTHLKSKRSNTAWDIRVPREDGFVFSEVINHDGTRYTPIVSVDGIVTDPNNSQPFSQLDISLQLMSIDGNNHARWHFDMANKNKSGIYQHGPLFHMQFGGHMPDTEDFWIKLPRWAHAPMDLILLLESVAANFYTDAWHEHLREDASWCENVTQSEIYCFTQYIQQISKTVEVRSRTVLSSLWANS